MVTDEADAACFADLVTLGGERRFELSPDPLPPSVATKLAAAYAAEEGMAPRLVVNPKILSRLAREAGLAPAPASTAAAVGGAASGAKLFFSEARTLRDDGCTPVLADPLEHGDELPTWSACNHHHTCDVLAFNGPLE
jgi:hypothetical protein